jgi:ABC-type transport system involved in multi-copper enzyme maturation permease subunit
VTGRIWAIALNTFREAARIRVLYAVAIVVVMVNAGTLVAGKLSVNEEARITQDFGVAATSLCGSLAAIVLGVLLLYSEVSRRTIHAIVSKPIARAEFVIGKYIGMMLVLTVLVVAFAITMGLILLVQGEPATAAIAKALVLAWLEVATVAAIAIFFSSFSTPFVSGIFALAMWLLGRWTPAIEDATSNASPLIKVTARVALEIVPDLHLFGISGQEVDGATVSVHSDFVSWGYVGIASGHAFGWIVALLAFACVLFHRRDFA